MSIPCIAHRVWFGEPFPQEYQYYLQTLANLNPDYTIKLWSDPGTMSPESYLRLQSFCKQNNIFLENIREHRQLINYDLIIKELDESQKNTTHQRIHYTRASDIARIAILINEGGNYTDTDSEMLEKFPVFIANQGLLLKLFGNPQQDFYFNFYKTSPSASKYNYFFCYILYDFIAAQPQHPLLMLAAEITRLDYETYQVSPNRNWEKSFSADVLKYGNIKLTGTSIKWALNYLHQNKIFEVEDPKELFLYTDNFMKAYYDKSWLEGFESGDKNDEDLNRFLSEIEEARKKHYWITDHGTHPDLKDNQEMFLFSSSLFKQKVVFEDYLLHLQTRNKPVSIQVELPQLQFKPSIPPIELPQVHFDVKDLSLSLVIPKPLPSRDKLYDVYRKNGGGLLASFSIFKKSSTESDIVESLRTRSQANSDENGASRKTLAEFNLL